MTDDSIPHAQELHDFAGLLNQRNMLGQATNWHEDDGAEELQDGHDAQDFACKPFDVGLRVCRCAILEVVLVQLGVAAWYIHPSLKLIKILQRHLLLDILYVDHSDAEGIDMILDDTS